MRPGLSLSSFLSLWLLAACQEPTLREAHVTELQTATFALG